ncbi:MAG: nucleotidyltransferase domain-containing protein [Proteobacteria bacterium]|nr:nucleotidyltransferase domain-containing protein [Pseudomonadota bacterium]MBU2226863.1 nucleotidyltransferase domain-containing protein [Pseudomonadota bacterium]MBU2261741.1 nucleotidyltransferase domain-containing protein [Pseudomonadota bacterium]
MLHKLFTSRVRVELLNTFFLHPEQSFYLRELERITGEDYKNISTELRNLESIGLLASSRSGNLKYFRLNQGFLLYSELKSVFFKIKGAPGLLKQVLSGSKDIEYAFIYGSFASGNENEISDIDLMVISKMPLENLLKLLREPERSLGRDINPSLFPISEIKQRIKDRDPFISRVMAEPKIMLIGDENELRRLAQ